jgi:Fe2+ transport system protein FeoA
LLQLNFRSAPGAPHPDVPVSLADLPTGASGVIERLDVADDITRRLMELGFLPGNTVTATRSAPGGDPRVFSVDGTEIALRKETAAGITVRPGRKG